MLQIFKDFPKTGVGKKAPGNVSWFVKSVLIEVVAENYRHLMHESVGVEVTKSDEHLHLFSPPLRSRERIISGIFATAISRVAPRSYPEYRVDRRLEDEVGAGDEDADLDETETECRTKAGRVDYLSFFHDRVIACELKSGFANADKVDGKKGCITEQLRRRWGKVVGQAASAHQHLTKFPDDYPNPVSLALLTVGARRVRLKSPDGAAPVEKDFARNFANSLSLHLSDKKESPPEFVAVYTFPEEFRRFVRLKRGQKQIDDKSEFFMPAIAFAVRVIS